jgi:hypothetical protein
MDQVRWLRTLIPTLAEKIRIEKSTVAAHVQRYNDLGNFRQYAQHSNRLYSIATFCLMHQGPCTAQSWSKQAVLQYLHIHTYRTESIAHRVPAFLCCRTIWVFHPLSRAKLLLCLSTPCM